jgi:proline iminopeptidase
MLLLTLMSSLLKAQQISEVRKINGSKLFISVRGEGEPLIILHGGPGLNHAYFKPHLQRLEKKYKLIYYDQRASGQSTTPSVDSISIKFLVDDLEAIRNEFEIKKLNILAHSWGAVLAVQYALHYRDNVQKLIISNPAMLSREYDQEASQIAKARTTPQDSLKRVQLMSSGEMDLKKYEDFFLLSFKISAYDPDNLTKLHLNLPANFPEASKALFSGLMKDPSHQANLYDNLNQLNFPVLIINGAADIIPPISIDRLRKNIPNHTYQIFSKSGHFPFVEETEKYNAVVDDFLGKKIKTKKRRKTP